MNDKGICMVSDEYFLAVHYLDSVSVDNNDDIRWNTS